MKGIDELTNYIVKNYPKKLLTKFIIGNHDLSHIIRSGCDIGKQIGNQRSDMIYLGAEYARIMLTPKCSMDLVHTRDGATYALSYAGQKYCDMLQGGSKPNIIIFGHRHKAMHYEYRNIQVIEAGTFQKQTAWMRGKRIAANVGGWIIEVLVYSDGTIKKFTPSWIPFYEMNDKDW